MNTTYTYQLTAKQKIAGFGVLLAHSAFFINIAFDFLMFHV